jgi:hypothetical protein
MKETNRTQWWRSRVSQWRELSPKHKWETPSILRTKKQQGDYIVDDIG